MNSTTRPHRHFLDCRVPALIEVISETGTPDKIDALEKRLAAMSQNDIVKFKALLEAVPCRSLEAALALTGTLQDYTLSPEFVTPSDIAAAKPLPKGPHPDPDLRGAKLLAACGGVLTGYGLLLRRDGQPVRAARQ